MLIVFNFKEEEVVFMKKMLILGLLLSSFAFSKSISVKTGKQLDGTYDGCVPTDYGMQYQGIVSSNKGYYSHMYAYANCEIGGRYFNNVKLEKNLQVLFHLYHFIQIRQCIITQMKIKFHLI